MNKLRKNIFFQLNLAIWRVFGHICDHEVLRGLKKFSFL